VTGLTKSKIGLVFECSCLSVFFVFSAVKFLLRMDRAQ